MTSLPQLLSRSLLRCSLSALLLLIGAVAWTAAGQDSEGESIPSGDYRVMEYGPVVSESIQKKWPENSLVRKGLAIRLGHDTAVIFDTDLVHLSAGLTGGWIDMSETDYTSYRGTGIAKTEGREVFGSSEIAGWAKDGSFYGPREEGLGPLPTEWAHYKGHYRYGNSVILSYRVGETNLLEMPAAIRDGEILFFIRNIQVAAAGELMQALILEMRNSWRLLEAEKEMILIDTGDHLLSVRLSGESGQGYLVAGETGKIELHLPPDRQVRTLQVVIHEEENLSRARTRTLPAAIGAIPDPLNLTAGGPLRWHDEISLSGNLGEGDFAYTVDRIPIPFDNPWNAWMRISGLDFFEDGTSAAITTWNGDVWIVSGIDDQLDEVRWRRFATGLFYPMGVAIVDGQIYVTERSQITRLIDLNGNGEADFYENFNNAGVLYPRAHSLTLEVDSEGYFYFFKNGNRAPAGTPQHGSLIRLSPDGQTREIYSNGSRGANTLGIGPEDAILSADQQGNWVPVERIDLMKPDRFYGYRPHGGEELPIGEFEPPVTWIPYDINNSSGLITYAGDSRWGPLAGEWILGSYGQSRLLLVLTQQLENGKWQGGVTELPLESTSGLMRGRMNPADGQLYMVGLRGWTTLGTEDASFERVRYTGGNLYLPKRLEVTPGGVEIEFTSPVDRSSVEDPENFGVERWEYLYTQQYGSPEVSLDDPDREGRDSVELRSATLSPDGRTLTLEIPDIRPVMQMKIAWDLTFEDGYRADGAIYHTINWLSAADAQQMPEWQRRIIARAEASTDEAQQQEEGQEPLFEGAEPEWFRKGELTYSNNCTSCHLRGGVAPSMEESEWAAESAESVIRILLHGKRGSRGVMTPFAWMDDEEIRSVVSYIRKKWYGKEPVESGRVEQLRRQHEDRTELWYDEELRRLLPE